MSERAKYLEFGSHVGDQGGPEDTVLVLDVSPSMNDKDLKPSRLQAAINAGNALIEIKLEQYPDDRVGLVTFASDATILQGLVGRAGFAALQQKLAKLRSNYSTNITAGLRKAGDLLFDTCRKPEESWSGGLSRMFKNLFFNKLEFAVWDCREETPNLPAGRRTQRSGRVILLTDGKHNTGPEPEPVAAELNQRGVVIDVIGVGGSPQAREFSEAQCKRIASRNPDGSARYAFIKDAIELAEHFRKLGGHLKALGS